MDVFLVCFLCVVQVAASATNWSFVLLNMYLIVCDLKTFNIEAA